MNRHERIAKLKKLGVYKKWVHNMIGKGYYHDYIVSHLETHSCSFAIFIMCSFGWANTPEGHTFWWNISQK